MTRFLLPSGKVVNGDMSFVIEQTIHVPDQGIIGPDGNFIVLVPAHDEIQVIQYPNGVRGLSSDQLTELEISEIVEQPRPDDTFAFVSENPDIPGAWIAVPFDADRIKSMLLSYAKNKRWEKEVGGIIVNGTPIATDDRSKMMIQGARIAADNDPNFVAHWDADDDMAPVALDAEQIVAISDAVLEHVAGVFDIYNNVRSGIVNGTVTSYTDIDVAFA